MSIQQGQLAEPQGMLFTRLRILPENAGSVLANQAVQIPRFQGGANVGLEFSYSKNAILLFGAASPVQSPVGYPNTAPSIGSLNWAKGQSMFVSLEEIAVHQNVSGWLPSQHTTFLVSDPQLTFQFVSEGQDAKAVRATSPAPSAESMEMVWLVRNAQELGQYKGQWLLIQGQELLIHTEDFRTIRDAIRQRQIRTPFVYYVPTDQESNSVSI